jgi:hypothetical protein
MSRAHITPWLRRLNYIEDYFAHVYDLYADAYVQAYPVTYYSTDTTNTVWDDNNMMGGTYEKQGVGEFSGQLWRKIQMFPVFGVEQVQPNESSDEQGGLAYNQLGTQIVFPSLYGIIPLEGDVVDMSFGYKMTAARMKFLYTVSNINLAHQSDFFQIYQCQLRMSPFNVGDLERQVSTDWMFYEHEKMIVPLENAQLLLKLQEASRTTTEKLNQLFDEHSGFYLGTVV